MLSLSGEELLNWPEFRALASRLGLSLQPTAVSFTIYIPLEGNVKLTQELPGVTHVKDGKDMTLRQNNPVVTVGMYKPVSKPQRTPQDVKQGSTGEE